MISFFRFQTILPSVMLATILCLLPNLSLARHYQIRTYQEWDGMPTNPVFDAAQDSLGRMWFCTRVGLTSYDGQQWEVHPLHANASAQPQAKLVVDSLGSFWTVSSRPPLRLSHRVAGLWNTILSTNIPINSYVLTGLDVLNLPDGTHRVALSTYAGQVLIWNGTAWKFIEKSEAMGHIMNSELVKSRLFFATTEGLFFLQLDNPDATIQPVPNLPAGPINNLARAFHSDSLWLAGSDWLGMWDGSQLTFKADNLVIVSPKAKVGTVALADRMGGLYFGGQRSVQYYHPDTGLEILSGRNGLVAGGATDFFEDREGNIWISSTRGISKLISRRFAGYNRETGLLEDEVSSIHQMANGQMVLGHEGGLTFLGPTINTLRFDDAQPAMSRVMDLKEDRWGNLWIAADRRGLARLSPRGLIRWFDTDMGLPSGVFALHLARDGTNWAGTGTGLYRQQGTHFKKVPLPGVEVPLVRRLVAGTDDSFYIATANAGIFWHQNDDTITNYLPEKSQTGRNCYTCYPLPDGGLYVGTAQGLYMIQDDILVPASSPHPVIKRPVYSILKDNLGKFWFGTDLGIMLWDGTTIKHFTVQDGLLGNETNRDALIQTTNGHIWIGTDSGASQYNPVFDAPAIGSPNLEITGFLVDGTVFPANVELSLNQPPHSLKVLYDGFSFVDETRTIYQTQLRNFENQWHTADAPNSGTSSLNYINISPGSYQFLVKAIRADGANSEVMVSPTITINPVFSDRFFVRAILILVILGMVWAVFAVISGRRYARRLEKEVYQQTWELRLSEKSIKSESHRLAATLKNISDGVLAVGIDGTIVLANAAAEKILKLSQADIIGRNLDVVIPFGTHQTEETHLRIPHPNQANHTLEVSSSSIPDLESADNNPDHGRVVAFRDITDILQQEEERIHSQKLESLGVFAGGLAHDFNNLLTVMLGNLSILEISPDIKQTDMQMVILVREASERAQSLTRQLLTFARGGMPLLETTSISQIVREAVDFSLSGTNVSCSMDLTENLWPVEVDPGQIHQVLGNLVINAVQAMPDGGNINITSRNIGSADRRMVMVEVADEGTGIAPENLTRIFDPYFTTKDLGSGLGLAMAYSIITKHGGNITVDSVLGKGSVFRVFLKAI